MKFSKESLQEQEHETVKCEIVDQRRWVTVYERVFKHDGKFYITYFERGSTEVQDTSPYEDEGDMIECSEVVPTEVTTIKYVAVQ